MENKSHAMAAGIFVLVVAALLAGLAVWLTRGDELLARQLPVGVWLDSHEGPEAIAGDIERFAVIAVNFPKFADGRGYSTARLLRERYGYVGEVRAIGDVLRDQLYFLQRCGFDSFALRADQPPEEALAAFHDYSWAPLSAR